MGNESGGERAPSEFKTEFLVNDSIKLLVRHIQRLTPSNSITFGELFHDREVEQTFESLVSISSRSSTLIPRSTF
jgi:hypothetical protein